MSGALFYHPIHTLTPTHPLLPNLQTSNDEAIAFYTRLGFEAGDVVRGYYRRLTPPDAVVLRRRLR